MISWIEFVEPMAEFAGATYIEVGRDGILDIMDLGLEILVTTIFGTVVFDWAWVQVCR